MPNTLPTPGDQIQNKNGSLSSVDHVGGHLQRQRHFLRRNQQQLGKIDAAARCVIAIECFVQIDVNDGFTHVLGIRHDVMSEGDHAGRGNARVRRRMPAGDAARAERCIQRWKPGGNALSRTFLRGKTNDLRSEPALKVPQGMLQWFGFAYRSIPFYYIAQRQYSSFVLVWVDSLDHLWYETC